MSDARVLAAVEQMEAWLGDRNWEPEAEVLAQWNVEFQAALAQAEKAPGWPDLVSRAHLAGQLLEAHIVVVAEERDRVRMDLAAQERGNRALRGYGASSR